MAVSTQLARVAPLAVLEVALASEPFVVLA